MGYLGTPADFTIIVMLVVIGVVMSFVWDRVGQLQRDVEALKRKPSEPPSSEPPLSEPSSSDPP